MDKSWMQINNRLSDEYIEGVHFFLKFSIPCVDKANRMRCPCRDCNNVHYRTVDIVKMHLLIRGMDQKYTRWIHHGEEQELIANVYNDEMDDNVDGVQEMLEDIHKGTCTDNLIDTDSGINDQTHRLNETEKFSRLLRDAKSALYPGNENLSKLSFIVKLMHIKTMYSWSNKSFDELLKLLKESFPPQNTLPKSHYECKTLIRDLGLGYIPIHACKNNCVLFRKEHATANQCPKCGESRYVNGSENNKKSKIPHKVLRYFPIKPRLQRLFMSRKTACDMRWYKDKRIVEEGVLRHPADSEVWKDFDIEFEWFAQDPRNVRLGLATDGFNPFGNMSNSYSMWPVMLMPYNLPPWKCMKEPFIILSLLIPGPKSPGNDIDVFLQPLVDDLRELWIDGVETYDASKEQYFQLHATLLWTINDFPAYANLSGWSTKGKLACPICNKETCSTYLRNGHKTCYMGHRRFLPPGHNWRKKTTMFDGKQDHSTKPKELSGEDLLEQLKDINATFGITQKKKRKRSIEELNWTKKSIFFELPYWKRLRLRHNLDVMHIEKNICDSVLGTLMNIEGKTKDSVKARLDLAEMGIKKELHLKLEGGKYVMPHPCFTLSKTERKGFCEFLKSVKYPDGYAANISRCVNTTDSKILGMKSHDCHVFLQRLLPVAIHGYMRKDVSLVFYELSRFFKELCRRTLKLEVLEQLGTDIALILCKLETILPPSFFDVMVHLAVHLPKEAKLAGPVQYRWMYPIERFLHTLKCYVRNKARPEGSIAEAYIDNECLTFCSLYLDGVETRFNREDRNDDRCSEKETKGLSVFSNNVRTFGGAKFDTLSEEDLRKARWYVLNNCSEVEMYLKKHIEIVRRQSRVNIEKRHEQQFPMWFKNHITLLRNQNAQELTDELYYLARGPDERVNHYDGCIVNGIRFRTKQSETYRVTQNSGVVVKGEHQEKDVDFYGVLNDVIELTYCGGNKVILLKCDWWDVGNTRNGIKRDDHFTSINVSQKWYKDDPFTLPSQAEQVFYVIDTKLGGSWQVVQRIPPRNLYDVHEYNANDTRDDYYYEDPQGLSDSHEPYESYQPNLNLANTNDEDVEPLVRNDVDSYVLNAEAVEGVTQLDAEEDDILISEESDEDDTLLDYYSDNEQVPQHEIDEETDLDDIMHDYNSVQT